MVYLRTGDHDDKYQFDNEMIMVWRLIGRSYGMKRRSRILANGHILFHVSGNLDSLRHANMILHEL